MLKAYAKTGSFKNANNCQKMAKIWNLSLVSRLNRALGKPLMSAANS